MSFIKCLHDNAKAGKITEKNRDHAINVWQRAYDNSVEAMGETAAIDHASLKAIEAVTKLNEDKRWARVNEIKKTAMLMQMLDESDRPDHVLIDIGDKLDIAQRRVLGQAHALMSETIEEHRPRFAGIYRPAQHSRNIIRALHGENITDEAAKVIAQDFIRVREFLRKRANMEGASLTAQPDTSLGILMDSFKLRKLEKSMGQKAARQQWINDHIDHVDWTQFEKELATETKQDFLNARYESLISEGNSKRASGFHSSSLTDRLEGRNRALYYKSANSWEHINEKYGSGNPYQQLISDIETMTKDIASLEVFGPNPQEMLQHLTRKPGGLALFRAEALANAGKAKRDVISWTEKEGQALKNRYALHSHQVANGEYSTAAQVLNTSRSLIMTAVLSSAFIANLGDMGFGVHQAWVNKIPSAKVIPKIVAEFVAMPVAERRKHAVRSGLIADGMTEMALNMQRYLGAFDGYHSARIISDVVFRAQGLNALTQATRWAWGKHLLGAFADHAHLEFKNVPFREAMERYNITAKDWDLFRATKINKERGSTWLRPIDLANRTDIDATVAQRTADKFFDFMNDTGKRAAPSMDTRTQQTIGGALGADTYLGQIARTVGALKSFPMFIIMNHLREGFMQATPKGRVGYITSMIVMMTVMGGMITQLKELAKGRDPRDMTEPSFWGRSLLNGGSLGFLGDALFSELNKTRGGGLGDIVAGPHLEGLSAFRDLTIGTAVEAMFGDGDLELKKKFTNFGATYLPKPWPIKLAADRLIFDEILAWADPNARRNALRREHNRLKENNQESWWRAYETSPKRGPDWSAAIGGSR